MRDDVPRLGFNADIRGRSMLTLAQETLRLSARGLARRQRLDRNGRDETRYLRPLEESIAPGSRRRRSCWRNTMVRGTAPSNRYSRNIRISLFQPHGEETRVAPRLKPRPPHPSRRITARCSSG